MKLKMKVKPIGSRLHVRRDATLASPVVNYLLSGDIVIVTQEKNGWVYHDKGGWTAANYLELIENMEGGFTTIPSSVINQTPVTGNAPYNETMSDLDAVRAETRAAKQTQASPLKQTTLSSDIKDSLKAHGIYDRAELDKFKYFKRFNAFDPYNKIRTVKEYLFFTKPDLNIYSDTSGTTLQPQLASDPIFLEIHNKNPKILHQLQRSVTANKGDFITLLSWTVKNTMDMPNIQSKDIDTSANQFGTRVYYRKHGIESDENHEFSLEFSENKSLDTYSFFKAWSHYNDLKSIGVVSPKDQYRDKMELHDQIAVYKIVVDEISDIIFYARAIGVYPKGAPRDSLSQISEDMTHNVSFKAFDVEDSNPIIIHEFNKRAKSGTAAPMFDVSKGRPGTALVTGVYIVRQEYKNKPGFRYQLKWRL